MPVLLIHGEQDFRAPIAHATGLQTALATAGNPPEFHKLPNEGHSTLEFQNQLDSAAQVHAFLRKHLMR